jgi:hypothetical protein
VRTTELPDKDVAQKINSDLHPEATNTYHNRAQHFSCRGKPSHLFSYGRVRTMELRCQPGQGVEGFWLHREGTMHDSYFKATRFGVDSKLCPREIDSFQTVISRGRGGRYVTVRCPCEYLHLFIELGW